MSFNRFLLFSGMAIDEYTTHIDEYTCVFVYGYGKQTQHIKSYVRLMRFCLERRTTSWIRGLGLKIATRMDYYDNPAR